jgi:hypothetical protein
MIWGKPEGEMWTLILTLTSVSQGHLTNCPLDSVDSRAPPQTYKNRFSGDPCIQVGDLLGTGGLTQLGTVKPYDQKMAIVAKEQTLDWKAPEAFKNVEETRPPGD